MKQAYTDEELVQGCIDNNRRHQEALYRRYFSKMMSMCRRYTDDDEIAMSVCNDGFLKVFKKIHTFSFKGSLEGWVRRVVYHCMSDYFRKNAKYLQFMVFEDYEQSSSPEIVPGLYFEDLMQLLKEVPEKSEQVFRLYAIEGYNHREIGEQLGISENTSKWHLSNARKRLQELIKEQKNNYVQRNK